MKKIGKKKQSQIDKLYKAIDSLIDVVEDVGFNKHEIQHVWIDKLRSKVYQLENN